MITVNQNLNNNDLLALVKKVETEGERIIIETENKGKVAIINYADLQELEDALEDAKDCAELRQSIAESSGEFYTLDQVLAERGLTLEDIMIEEDE
jgi:PHD/YefM family antitoxin component YafN of YafNO toxin-antitoxin module